MGISENWSSFVNMTKAKADSHGKVAQYWDSTHNIMSLSLIVLSAMTTLSTLLPITHYIPATLGAITTLLSAVAGSMSPSTRRQQQMESSKGFRSLMLKMVRVETEREYEELWKEYNKELLGEPFLPAKYRVKEGTNFTMTPEFTIIVKQKENEVEEMIEELEGSEAGDEVKPDEVKPVLPEPQNEAPQEADKKPGNSEEVGDDVKLLHQV
ncbi:uncharacterized protein LOC134817262 isoform X2 [Bolinopsis microptera]|uniref:uncharacterized protein LOC134817262 isoform X2 n=1 Tax=Bolinopsis microptera TaxID=2820187 RepID=UPI0030795507